MLGELLEKLSNVFAAAPQDKEQEPGDNAAKQESHGTIYRCSQCGKEPLSGPVLYCDGCGQYMCYTCGVASGDMVFDCPNCAIEAQRVNL